MDRRRMILAEIEEILEGEINESLIKHFMSKFC